MGTFVMIGGRSGSGKSTIINELCSVYPDIFIRPKSYTTRKKRDSEMFEEYIFINNESLKSMEKEELLLNTDTLYGEMYAIEKKDFFDKLYTYKYIIKEVHPSKQQLLRNKINNTLSILLLSDAKSSCSERSEEDNVFYNNIDYSQFDLIFHVDTNKSVSSNATLLYKQIEIIAEHNKTNDSSILIDMTNRKGYSKIANEFTEEKRITTKNFHDTTYTFFNNIISLLEREKVLEVGAGRGWLRNNFIWNANVEYHSIDISDRMNKLSDSASVTTSVKYLPFLRGTFDYVFSSLGDPYFYPAALLEIKRVLKDTGVFAFSIPAKVWADNLEGRDKNKTTFIVKGSEVETYSFTFTKEELLTLLNKCGFKVVFISSNLLPNDYKFAISPALIKSAHKIGKNVYELPVTETIICIKKEGY